MTAFVRILALVFALTGLALAPMSASAMGSDDDSPAKKSNPDFDAGKQAIDAQQWEKAIASLTKAVQVDSTSAEAFNYLGYAYRKSGNYENAFVSYKQALELNPRHKGAHEYIGEAYLETGDLKSAEFHLKRLDSICFFGCAEYSELKKAVAAYKAKQSS